MATSEKGKRDKATRHAELALHERALRIVEAASGPDDVATAGAMSAVALNLWCLDRPEEALPLYRRVLEVRAAKLPEGDHRLSAVLMELGDMLIDMDRCDEAIPFLERAARTLDAQDGRAVQLVVHLSLGRALLGARRFDEACAHFEIALRRAEADPEGERRDIVVAKCRGWLERARRGPQAET